MNILDLSIIISFLFILCIFGLFQSYTNKSQKDFFLAGKNISWITAMFSIVATETSVLTFISIPGIAYRGDWTFLQLALGYFIGRVLVSFFLIPLYFKNGIISIYEILKTSFGVPIQKLASATFLLTRVFADGVRFAAIAIVIQSITGWSIILSIILVGLITLVYTVLGGLKAVIKIDAFQFIIYLISALICIYYLFQYIDYTFLGAVDYLNNHDKFKIFDFSNNFIYKPFVFFSAVLGGAMLSFCSHGVDYMMVQRVLATKDITSARKAMIGSGIFVLLQFILFLFVGSLLFIINDCNMLNKNQEVSFIIKNILPNGMKGIVVAGILSVAMSTLSSSINSLSASTINDWFPNLNSVKNSQIISIFWTVILILTALFFSNPNDPLLIIGLKIASFTYGSLLSLFLLSKVKKKIDNNNICIGFVFGIIVVFYLMKLNIAWTFYILISVISNLTVVLFLQTFNYYFMRIIFVTIIFLSLIPIFSNENKNVFKTNIIDFEIKSSCLDDSIWYGSDIMKSYSHKFDMILNVGIIVNHTSSIININDQEKNILVDLNKNHINVKKIFTPEHGLNNDYQAGDKINSKFDYNIPIISLYGNNLKPSDKDLESLDALIFDIQDIGSRYYTYVSTLTKIMESCSDNDIPLYVLDRPNPIGGVKVEGPILNLDFLSFVGMHPIPIMHGMTIGEIAFMINELKWLTGNKKIDLNIVKMQGWDRIMNYENTGKKWISPSPNIANAKTAFIYNGTCLIEGTNLSEGRGTNMPFHYIGAPWIDSSTLISKLKLINFRGIKFKEISFTPRFMPGKATYPKYKDQRCFGVEMLIVDKSEASPLIATMFLIDLIYQMYPKNFKFLPTNFIDKLYGSDKFRLAVLNDSNLDSLIQTFKIQEDEFILRRKPFLLY